MPARFYFIMLLWLCPFFVSAKQITISSPDKQIKFSIGTDASGLFYSVNYRGEQIVAKSPLKISFVQGGAFGAGLKTGAVKTDHLQEDYQLIIGKASKIHSDCNRLLLPVQETGGLHRKLTIEVRIFNDGAAFRYVIPEWEGNKQVQITDETDAFNLTNNPRELVLFRQNYTTSHEGIYDRLPLQNIKPDTLMDMPALFEYPNGTYVAITEAALRDYAGMYLIKHNGVLQSALSPLPHQTALKVKATLPHNSPWRVMMISNRVGALIESNILTNLNEPCAIKDVSWIKPGKTTFPWWNGNVSPDTSFAPGNNFNFNNYYVKFCAANHITYHSVVEYGLHEWYVNDGEGFQPGPHADPTTPVPGLDMQQICDSAKKLGVGIRVWIHWAALYPKLDATFTQLEKWGVQGLMCDFMDRDDQEMVNIQEEILRKAAEHHLHIQFHGAYKPTGLSRTYPNEFTREGTLNYENDKWNDVVTPDADINIPFTRMLAGSTDYHLGGFHAATPATFKVHYTRPFVQGTRCHMLGMYVVLENALGMVCDDPKAYEGQPGFEFVKQVPTVWDETRVPDARVGEFLTIARRSGNDWYVGSISNTKPRKLDVSLSFLPPGNYRAEIYSDASDADVNADHLVKEVREVTNKTVINAVLAPGGGQVIRLIRE